MILDENVQGYIRSLEPELPPVLLEIEEYAHKNAVPIIKKDAQSMLRFLMKSERPKRILEIGTAIGFSALFMLNCNPGCEIVTLEKDEARIAEAKKNIRKFAENSYYNDNIRIMCGEAIDSLKLLCEDGTGFDFVFLDAAKAQYSQYMTYIRQLQGINGVLLTDNILQEGSVAESKFSVTRRDRTIHKRMRDFIAELMDDKDYASVIIPLGDGMLLSRRQPAKDEGKE